MKNQDEPSLRSAVIAILVVAAIVATLLIPLPPAKTPTIELEPTAEQAAIAPRAHAAPLVKPVLNPAMRPVCACESVGNPDKAPQHFDEDGGVLHGKQNPDDIGMCQLNEPTWGDKATELGWDIYTPEGNILMANWIYANEGYFPWRYSKGCHGKK